MMPYDIYRAQFSFKPDCDVIILATDAMAPSR